MSIDETGLVGPEDAAQIMAAAALADQTYGLMRIGGALLALPVSAIREVVPEQTDYAKLPVKAEGLLGAVDIRGAIIPVLDLRETLGLAAGNSGTQVIVIMRYEGRLIGLTVDEVSGIARPEPEDLFSLSAAAPRLACPLATHSFQTLSEIATVLSAKGIAELPAVPLVEEKILGRHDAQAAARESILLFRYGRSHLGIDATCVDATVPAVAIRKTSFSVGPCLGVIDHHGYEVPVVDTQAMIGLGMGEPQALTPVIVIRFGNDALLGLAIDEVRDIVRLAGADIVDMPLRAPGKATLFRGMIAGQGEQQDSLVLNAAALRADHGLVGIAALQKSGPATPGAAAGRSAGQAGRPLTYLTYAAGAELATPLEQIKEILHYPAHIAPFDFPNPALLGLFKHRDRVTPLISLASLLGKRHDPDPVQARVLFVEHAGMTAGFVVEALRSIDTGSWRSAESDAPQDNKTLFKSLVMIGADASRRMVSQLDLLAEIAAFYDASARDETPPPSSPGPRLAA
jgi:chemotaxis signal transduction protein